MRYVIIFFVLTPLLSNCASLLGGMIGNKIDSKTHETTDKFRQYGQNIVMVKKDGEKVTGTFRGFVYLLDSTNQHEPSTTIGRTNFKKIPFPNIGDSISVQTEHRTIIDGKFSGMSYSQKGFRLMVFTDNPAKVNYITFHMIDQLGGLSGFSEIVHPDIKKVYLQYQENGNLAEVALSDLTFKRTNATTNLTLIGVAIDVAGIIAAISVGNQLKDFRSDN